jgi:hypothetical protein
MMIAPRRLWQLCVLLSWAAPALAITDRQFRQFWPDGKWGENTLLEIVNGNCSLERDRLFADPNRGGYKLVTCILEHSTEARKAEMAICTVILGLLPVAMQLIGPKLSDISVLALRRPILAFFVCIGSPTVTLSHDKTGMEPISEHTEAGEAQEEEKPLWPEVLTSTIAKVAISFLEYFGAVLSAGNALYHAYGLSFYCVTLISTLLGTFGHKPEAYSPLLWVLLPLPIQALGVAALLLDYDSSATTSENVAADRNYKLYWARIVNRLKLILAQEVTPCAFRDPGKLPTEFKSKRSYKLYTLICLVKLGSWIHVLMGTIILSSVLFVSLFDTLQIVGLLLGGTLICRVVVAFEMYGLREVACSPSKGGALNA